MTEWNALSSDERHQTRMNMLVYGGSFAAAIAQAWVYADSCNSERLAAAFPDLINRYQPKNWSTPCVDAQ